MRLAAVGLLLVFASLGLCAEPTAENAASLRYLLALRQADGGFVSQKPDPKGQKAPQSSLRATSLAVRAIKYLGGELPNKEQTVKFVESCYDAASGGFAEAPGGKPDMPMTIAGMMAANELMPKFNFDPSIKYLVTNAKTFEERRLAVAGMESAKKFDPIIAEWFKEIAKTKNPDGTYGKTDGQARETGSVAAMILRSGGKIPDDHLKAVHEALFKGQRSDGGFGKAGDATSDLETTYRVMRSMHLLGIQPKEPKAIRNFLSMCANKDGGYAIQPGQPSNAASTYFAASIMHWLKK